MYSLHLVCASWIHGALLLTPYFELPCVESLMCVQYS